MANKLVLEVDENCVGRIVVNGEELKDVTSVEINVKPLECDVTVEQVARDRDGRVVLGNGLSQSKKTFHFWVGD